MIKQVLEAAVGQCCTVTTDYVPYHLLAFILLLEA